MRLEHIRTLEFSKVDEEGKPGNISLALCHQFSYRLGRPTCGNQIIYDENSVASFDGVFMHLNRIRSILKFVLSRDCFCWELARFTRNSKRAPQPQSLRSTKYEPSALNPNNQINLPIPELITENIDGFTESTMI